MKTDNSLIYEVQLDEVLQVQTNLVEQGKRTHYRYVKVIVHD